MNTAIIVQCRLESTRFPNKALALLAGQPLLLHVLDRLSQVPLSHTILVACPDTPANVAIQDLCTCHGYECLLVSGDPNDVLMRYAVAAAHVEADVIVRITGDCPLVSPDVMTRLAVRLEVEHADYAYLAPEWGDGFDAGCFTRAALNRAHGEATRLSDREHVEPLMRRPEAHFTTACLPCPYDLSWMRLSVDTPDDLRRVELLLGAALETGYGPQPEWRTLAALCERYPRHKDGMARKPLNAAYHAQVAAEDLALTPAERAAYRERFPQWHDAVGNYIADSVRKAEAR